MQSSPRAVFLLLLASIYILFIPNPHKSMHFPGFLTQKLQDHRKTSRISFLRSGSSGLDASRKPQNCTSVSPSKNPGAIPMAMSKGKVFPSKTVHVDECNSHADVASNLSSKMGRVGIQKGGEEKPLEGVLEDFANMGLGREVGPTTGEDDRERRYSFVLVPAVRFAAFS
eukprot:259555-Amorphochlora_amoeboformis.AAC.1